MKDSTTQAIADSPLNRPILLRLAMGDADTHELMNVTRVSKSVLSGRLQRLRNKGLIEPVRRKPIYGADGKCNGAIWIWRKVDGPARVAEYVRQASSGPQRYRPDFKPLTYDMHALARLNAR